MKNYTGTGLFIILIGALYLCSSCQEKEQISYFVPTTYNFDNVDYSGQTARISMLKELVNYTHTANSSGASPLDSNRLNDMYTNSNAPFSEIGLNNTTKQLKSKVIDNEQYNFGRYLTALALNSQRTNAFAAINQAGIVASSSGETFLINKNGMELSQIIEKGLASACFYYQATSVYLGASKINVDNKAVIPGKGTNMEHHWDESFGYYGAPIDFPSNINDLSIWAEYSNQVNSVLGSNAKMMNAYLEGRAAITALDYDTRDAMRSEIKFEWEIIVAAVSISCLNVAKNNLTNPGMYHHSLSQAYAFIMGLKYGASNTLSNVQVNNILANLTGSSNPLQANLYTTTSQDIDDAINSITSAFPSLDPIKASL